MKKLILLVALCLPTAQAWCAGSGKAPRELIEARNREFSRALVGEDLAAVLSHYAADAMLMPEHSTARYGTDAIEGYYRQWFAGAAVDGLHKTVREVLDYGRYAVETGTFVQTFARPASQPYRYAGKYMVLWAIDGGQARILSELWGADAPFDDAALPAIQDAPSVAGIEFSKDAKVAAEIAARNALIGRLVTERKGAEHADLFLPDAVYMTYYTPMLVGMDDIRPYFIEHEKPGPLTIESLELHAGNIYPMDGGRLQLEQGFYRVDWRAGNDSGTVRGKSLNLWKRDADGTLMLFRQAVNHD
ncbi:MAG: DUF4440 domain-containing protein [Pseudoxanthomonas sp.]